VCACSSQSLKPCQRSVAGWVEDNVRVSFVVSVVTFKGVLGFGSVCEVSSSVDDVCADFAVRVGVVWVCCCRT